MADEDGPMDGWDEHRRAQLLAIARGTTPARRLAWLEEALRIALLSGALERERASRQERGRSDDTSRVRVVAAGLAVPHGEPTAHVVTLLIRGLAGMIGLGKPGLFLIEVTESAVNFRKAFRDSSREPGSILFTHPRSSMHAIFRGETTLEFWLPDGKIMPFDFERPEDASSVYEALKRIDGI